MRLLIGAICLLSVTACSNTSPVGPGPVDRQVVLAPGQTAAVAPDLSIEFVGVLGDSRCPADALCVLGGDAVVRITISAGEQRAERDLHTGTLARAALGRARVELLELAPYPFSAKTIEPEDYRATLRVVR